MTGTRTVFISIDALTNLFKDYVLKTGDLPEDAKPVKLYIKPTELGKFAIEMDSDSWSTDLAPLQITFDIKKVFSVS